MINCRSEHQNSTIDVLVYSNETRYFPHVEEIKIHHIQSDIDLFFRQDEICPIKMLCYIDGKHGYTASRHACKHDITTVESADTSENAKKMCKNILII